MNILGKPFVDVDTNGCSVEEVENIIKKVKDSTNKEPLVVGELNKIRGDD